MNKRNALLSVFDKTGIIEFAQSLVRLGWNLYSSGGTAAKLAEAGVSVTDVSELVGGGAILGHRVVTLSREVHAGLLARPVDTDLQELESLGIPYIDLVCVDLYPLEDEIANPDSTRESVIEKTDIGGPTMLRSAAKGRRIVVSMPAQRSAVVDWLEAGEPDAGTFKDGLAATAEFVCSGYALASARFTSDGHYDGIVGRSIATCDYGENRWQSPASLYETETDDPLALNRFRVVNGRSPSFINWTDVDRLLQTLTHLAAGHEANFGSVPLMAVAVKHGNPCGAATGDDAVTVLQKMVMGDPLAVFGAVMMTNFPITVELATLLREYNTTGAKRLFDGVCAPDIEDAAFRVLARKDGKYALLVNPALGDLTVESLDPKPIFRPVRGGFLKQPNYTHVLELDRLAVSPGDKLTFAQQRDVVTAWAVCATSNSNTVSLVRHGQLIGNGVGQQDRKRCCELAVKRAVDSGHDVRGAVAASDSFFPFPDGPEVLIDAGVGVIFSTSGSNRDEDTQVLCQEWSVTLVQQPDSEARSFYRH